jgi:hypothetical protein
MHSSVEFISVNELQNRGAAASQEESVHGIRGHCWRRLVKTQLTETKYVLQRIAERMK